VQNQKQPEPSTFKNQKISNKTQDFQLLFKKEEYMDITSSGLPSNNELELRSSCALYTGTYM